MKIAFEEILQELDWIEPKTRTIALQKYRQMRNYIAYPDYLEANTSVLVEYYREVSYIHLQLISMHLSSNSSAGG